MSWLSIVPNLLIVAALAAVLIAWRSGRRSARIAVGAALSIVAVLGLLGSFGASFSAGGSSFIGIVGFVLLLAGLGGESTAG